jgi:decaprenylphospho-beta-D-ribofuranose 2-oxidase
MASSEPGSHEGRTTLLTGWGRTAATGARLSHPAGVEQVIEAIGRPGRGLPARGLLARGLGRGYGDSAQNAGGDVLSMLRLDGLELDEQTGIAVVGAGLSIDALLRVTVPKGWFVPVTPGTRFVTIGGAIAADVHGKNHHGDGTFAQHVLWLDLVDGTGTLRRLSPSATAPGADQEAFWATAGGLGLTGVITRAALRLRPITSSWMSVDTERVATLDQLMDRLRGHDRRFPYTVAWVDVLARGRRLGRGVITSGVHADQERVRAQGIEGPTGYRPRRRLTAPMTPLGTVTPVSARAFNELWYRRAPRQESAALQPLEAFFHPLDRIRDWNRLYGPHGFVQYQFVVPDGREDVVEQALSTFGRGSTPAFLAVLKRFGDHPGGPLSFPRAGWTLAVDLPARARGRLAAVLDTLDRVVADAAGAVYLVKDSRCRPDLVAAMYPRLDEWRMTRHQLDPERRFASDLSRRVGL